MDKEEKKKVMSSPEDLVIEIWVQVATKKITMAEAERGLHEFVNSLPEDKQAEFRSRSRAFGLLLMSVSEAFLQQLTVIAAGR